MVPVLLHRNGIYTIYIKEMSRSHEMGMSNQVEADESKQTHGT